MRFVTKRERWGLTWQGWLAFLIGVLLLGIQLIRTVYPFLAVTKKVATRTMVVEGWVPKFAIELAAREFTEQGYERIFTTGGPVQGTGRYINDYNTSASVGAGLLKAAGVPAAAVQMVPSREMRRDRTYSSAVALREWLAANHLQTKAFNVVTEGTHARRTRLLYEKAFGSEVQVGIIAAHSPDYDSHVWWRYSQGVKDVEGEVLAYFYARFFFFASH